MENEIQSNPNPNPNQITDDVIYSDVLYLHCSHNELQCNYHKINYRNKITDTIAKKVRLRSRVTNQSTTRGAGSGGQEGQVLPCLLICLKRGGRGGRLCSLKLVLQVNFFCYALQLTYIILITIKSNNICRITKTTLTHSTIIKAR